MATTAATGAGLLIKRGGQHRADPGRVAAEDLVVDRHQRVDALSVHDRQQSHARGRWHVELELGDLGNHQCLQRLGPKPGREQPVGQVRRPVVGVVLPLPSARDLSEPDDLGGDGAIGCHLVDVAPRHAPPSLAQ
jgi:hypothetical protein